MCGRFANAHTVPELRRIFQASGDEFAWAPSWNITPTRKIPVILGGLGERRLGPMVWGWHPSALRGRLLINCRGEEAHQKRLFQEILPRRRCLIPATAFYEWKPAATRKERPQPFAFGYKAAETFAIGGLWMGKEGGGEVILMTVPANGVVDPIHDRMPLVIHLDDRDAWLDAATPLPAVRSLILPDGDDAWNRWCISRAIGNVRHDEPTILDEIPDPTGTVLGAD